MPTYVAHLNLLYDCALAYVGGKSLYGIILRLIDLARTLGNAPLGVVDPVALM
jgi:hypothetical protein